MRIIGGCHQRRLIRPPAGLPVRPTTDKAREALFNVLNNHFDFESLRVLDLFAGTGSISFEFASRGGEVVAVEKDPRCVGFIRQTAKNLGMDRLSCFKADVFRFLKHPHPPFDVVFADPPYEMDRMTELPGAVFSGKLLAEGGWLVIEHSEAHAFGTHPHFFRQRRYSRVHFSFFSGEHGLR